MWPNRVPGVCGHLSPRPPLQLCPWSHQPSWRSHQGSGRQELKASSWPSGGISETRGHIPRGAAGTGWHIGEWDPGLCSELCQRGGGTLLFIAEVTGGLKVAAQEPTPSAEGSAAAGLVWRPWWGGLCRTSAHVWFWCWNPQCQRSYYEETDEPCGVRIRPTPNNGRPW